jgi:hypothetical protein
MADTRGIAYGSPFKPGPTDEELYQQEQDKIYARLIAQQRVQEALRSGVPPQELEAQLGGLESPMVDPIDLATGGAYFKLAGIPLKKGIEAMGKTAAGAAIGRIPGAGFAKSAVSYGADESLGKLIPQAARWQLGAAGMYGVAPEWSEENPNLSALAGAFAGDLAGGGASLARKGAVDLAMKMAPKTMASPEAGRINFGGGSGSSAASTSLWKEHVADKLLNPAIDALSRVPILPEKGMFGGISKALGGNTLRQWGVHPMDRMPKEAGELFQSLTAASRSTGTALGQLGKRLNDLNLEERAQVINFLKAKRRTPDMLTPELQEKLAVWMRPLEGALNASKDALVGPLLTGAKPGRVASRLNAMYERGLTRAVNKVFQTDVDDPIWKLVIQQHARTADLTTKEGTEAFLKKIIDDPALSVGELVNDPTMVAQGLSQYIKPEAASKIRQIAVDHYNLAAMTGQDLSARMKGVFEGIATRRVLQNPDWAMPESQFAALPKKAKKGWLKVPGHRELEGVVLKRDIAEGFIDFDMTPGKARKLFNTFLMTPWKTMKVGWNIAARPRDLVSNFIFNDVGGAHPLSIMNQAHYYRVAKEMKQRSPAFLEWKRLTGGSGSMMDNNLSDLNMDPILTAMRHGSGIPGLMMRTIYDPDFGIKIGKGVWGPGKYTEFMAKLANGFDDWAKFAKYKWNLEHGMDNKAAMMDALRTVGDPNRQTPAIKMARDWVLPFAGWQAHALKTMGQGMIDRPIRPLKYFAIPAIMSEAAMSHINMTDEEFAEFKGSLPDYMRAAPAGVPAFVPLPYRDEHGRIQMMDVSWWIPGLQDLAELGKATSGPMGLFQSPFANLYAALKTNKKFSGAPIYHEWEPNDVKGTKLLWYIYEQMAPAMAGTVVRKTIDSAGNDPRRPTLAQATGSLVGYRVTGVDPGDQVDRAYKLQDQWGQQAKAQMTREIINAGEDMEKLSEIEAKYQAIFEDIYKPLSERK